MPIAQRIRALWIMDTPGQDIESISGMVAGGAQIVIFYYRSRNACR
ncbi:hydrolase, UxaA family [Salmonella enterica subsp. enterica]|uniref:Hydrolase, UxaA family n=1 Tax=Salmonella enterica I TaxID=59201 RepID=A0A3S4JHI3_SALET|nr:hydrolase, UxaA family [Salmonella enterica subsp. enterica]